MTERDEEYIKSLIDQSIAQKERDSERLITYRKALYLSCGGDLEKIKEWMRKAEEILFPIDEERGEAYEG